MSIHKLRLERGWTQEQIAEHSGLSVRTIQRIENGNPANLESLKCLAAVFETSVSSLMQEPKMTNDTTAQTLKEHQEREAIEYVQNLKAFHMHWISFVVILPCLYVFNITVTPEYLWIGWVLVPWGLALAFHAVVIHGLFNVFGADWEQREFRKRMNALDR